MPEIQHSLKCAVTCKHMIKGLANLRSSASKLLFTPQLNLITFFYLYNHCSDLKFILYSAHDTTLMAVLHALGVYDFKWPKFAADVKIELYQDEVSGSLLIKPIRLAFVSLLIFLFPFNSGCFIVVMILTLLTTTNSLISGGQLRVRGGGAIAPNILKDNGLLLKNNGK